QRQAGVVRAEDRRVGRGLGIRAAERDQDAPLLQRCDGRTVSRTRPTAPDAGLFGPGSVTWRLHADPMLGIAGLRALMLQALHPRAAQAFNQHSTFRDDVWGRLARTVAFIGATTFDSTPEALAAGAR